MTVKSHFATTGSRKNSTTLRWNKAKPLSSLLYSLDGEISAVISIGNYIVNDMSDEATTGITETNFDLTGQNRSKYKEQDRIFLCAMTHEGRSKSTIRFLSLTEDLAVQSSHPVELLDGASGTSDCQAVCRLLCPRQR
jgi:hypothetical protein